MAWQRQRAGSVVRQTRRDTDPQPVVAALFGGNVPKNRDRTLCLPVCLRQERAGLSVC